MTDDEQAAALSEATHHKQLADTARAAYEAAAVRAYRAGARRIDVAKALGFSPVAVDKLLERHGVERRPRARGARGRYRST